MPALEEYSNHTKETSKRKFRKYNDIMKTFENKYMTFIYIYLLIILCVIKSKEKRNLILNSSSINIMINAPGIHKIYSSNPCNENSYILPNKITINGIEQQEIKSEYNLHEEINNISLHWEEGINSTACLFRECYNITKIDLSDFNSNELKYVHGMFWHCKELTSINFLNFDSSKVIDMHYLFTDCQKINNLNLSMLDTSLVTDIGHMFAQCYNLSSLDISHFNTLKVRNMHYMFQDCYSLTSLDLSNFNTTITTKMHNMFENCILLSNINLSSFITLRLKHMGAMFKNCISLTSLDLSNFDLSKVTNMSYMFENCNNLEYINFSYSQLPNSISLLSIFNGTAKNLVICTIDDILKNEIQPECNIIDCNDNWREKQKKIINDICYDNCSSLNNYDYNGKCYDYCPNGTYNDNYICKECDQTCLICTNSSSCIFNELENEEDLVHSTKTNNIEIFSESDEEHYSRDRNTTEIFSETNEDYYLNESDLIENSCYYTCKKCLTMGNNISHNCLECKDEFPFEEIFSNYKNCYNISINEESNEVDKKIKQLQFDIINNFDPSYIGRKTFLSTKEKNILISFTTTYSQIFNVSKNETSINLGQCEYKLKDIYNISYNDSLYILKLEVNETGMKVPKIEYEVYYPLYDKNLIKLNLSVCEEYKIELLIPVYINDNVEKYNQSSNYYNDICSQAKSKYGTDICIKDRQDEFIDNNMTLCEENCDLIDYDYDNNKAKCSCKIKVNLPLVENIEIDTDELYKRFTDINYLANINMLKCLKKVLKKNELKNNYGFIIFIFINTSFLITFILFISKYYQLLKNIILDIISAKIIAEEKEKKIENKNNINKNKIIKSKNKKKILDYSSKSENTFTKLSKRKKDKEIKFKNENKNKKRKRKNKKNNKSKDIQIHDKKNNCTINLNYMDNSKNIESSKIEMKNIENKKNENILELNDLEMNNLPYEQALDKDKRTYSQYYFSLLNTNHLFFFSFLNNTDYNLKVIKIFLFIFSFTFNFTVNALFFNNKTIHKIYEDEGKFNFFYQIPQIIYSSLISVFINILIKQLALSEKAILKIKQEKINIELNIKQKVLFTKLKIKFTAFFTLTLIILMVFWAFITCFCGVYKNNQSHLIKDSLVGFIISLIYPFAKYLIPGIFRISALKTIKKDKKCMYKFSQLFQFI